MSHEKTKEIKVPKTQQKDQASDPQHKQPQAQAGSMKMKSTLALLCVVAVIAFGCSTAQKEQTCANATSGMAAYLAVINAGGTPSDDEAKIAAGATAFLVAYCGWQPVTTPVATRGVGESGSIAKLDQYGVPVVVPGSWNQP